MLLFSGFKMLSQGNAKMKKKVFVLHGKLIACPNVLRTLTYETNPLLRRVYKTIYLNSDNLFFYQNTIKEMQNVLNLDQQTSNLLLKCMFLILSLLRGVKIMPKKSTTCITHIIYI